MRHQGGGLFGGAREARIEEDTVDLSLHVSTGGAPPVPTESTFSLTGFTQSGSAEFSLGVVRAPPASALSSAPVSAPAPAAPARRATLQPRVPATDRIHADPAPSRRPSQQIQRVAGSPFGMPF